MTVIDRPFADFTSVLVVLRADMAPTRSRRYSTGSPVKLPLLILYLGRFCSVMPGLTTSPRHLIHIHVALIADDETFVAVEHAQALRHVVDRNPHA